MLPHKYNTFHTTNVTTSALARWRDHTYSPRKGKAASQVPAMPSETGTSHLQHPGAREEHIHKRAHTSVHPQRTQRQQQSIISIQASQVTSPIQYYPTPSRPATHVFPFCLTLARHPPTPGGSPFPSPHSTLSRPTHTQKHAPRKMPARKRIDFHICPYSYYSRGGINKSKKEQAPEKRNKKRKR